MSPLTGNHTVFFFLSFLDCAMAARVPGGPVIITETSATSLALWLIHQAGRRVSQKEFTLRWLRLRDHIRPSPPPPRLTLIHRWKGNRSWRLGVWVVFLLAVWSSRCTQSASGRGRHRRPSHRFEKTCKLTWSEPDRWAELRTPQHVIKLSIVKCFKTLSFFFFLTIINLQMASNWIPSVMLFWFPTFVYLHIL